MSKKKLQNENKYWKLGAVTAICLQTESITIDAWHAQPEDRPLCGSELRSCFFHRLWTKVYRIKFSVRSLQRRFPTDDVLLRFGDGSSREVVNRAEISMFLGCQISGGGGARGHPNF